MKIDNILRDFSFVEFGVSQGTVLRPVTFNLYLNDLLREITVGNIVSLEDDTAVTYQADNWNTLKEVAVLKMI